MDSGGKIPFGAQAYDKEERVVGMVDNLSRLLVFGIEDQGRLVHSLERWLLFRRLSVAAQEQGPDLRTSCAQLPSVLDLEMSPLQSGQVKGEDFSGEHRARGQAAAHSSSIMLNRSGVLPRVSKRSNHCLAANPPAKPVRPPEAPITLWQGATMDSGFRPLAAPTARTALGLPICTAISV